MILVGKSGQLARSYLKVLGPRSPLVLGRSELDLSEPARITERLDAVISRSSSRVLVNTAAYTAVDRAESENDLAERVNSEAPVRMAEWAKKNDFLFVHYSTDYVYDGAGTHFRSETETTNPLGAYGRTKLAGEIGAAAAGENPLIFRTSWLYDLEGKNFPNTMLRLGRERAEIRVVDDQVGAPTYTDDLARLSLAAIEKTLLDRKLGGTYHLANAGAVSWCEFAERIFRGARTHLPAEKWATVIGIPSSEYPTPAKRPTNSRLSLEKFKTAFSVDPRSWESALAEWEAEKYGPGPKL